MPRRVVVWFWFSFFPSGNAASFREKTKALAVDRGCTQRWKLVIYRGCVVLFHCVTPSPQLSWQSSVTKYCHPSERSEQTLPCSCLVRRTWLNWHKGAAGAANRGMSAHCSSVLKIQLLGSIKSEFTSIKRKLSISHSSIIKYWHQK